MSLITVPVGISIIAWTGPTTTLTSTSWFNSTNINGIFKQSPNRLGYISAKPGAAFPGFTQLIPAPSGSILPGYIFSVKTAFQLDDSLLGVIDAPVILPAENATVSDVAINNNNLLSFSLPAGAKPADFDLIVN